MKFKIKAGWSWENVPAKHGCLKNKNKNKLSKFSWQTYLHSNDWEILSSYKVLLAGYDLPDKIKIWNAHFHYGAEALHAVTPLLDLVPNGNQFLWER